MEKKAKVNSKVMWVAICGVVGIAAVFGYFQLNKPADNTQDNNTQAIRKDEVFELGLNQDPTELLKDWDTEEIECCKFVDAAGNESTEVTEPGEYTMYFTTTNKGYVTEYKMRVNVVDDTAQ